MGFKLEEKWRNFDDFWWIYRQSITTTELLYFQNRILSIFLKVVPLLSVTPSRRCVTIDVTYTMYISTHNVYINKPCWGMINREKI